MLETTIDDWKNKYYDIFMSPSNIKFILDFSLKRKKFDSNTIQPNLESLMKKIFKENIDTILSKNTSESNMEKNIGVLNKHVLSQFLNGIDAYSTQPQFTKKQSNNNLLCIFNEQQSLHTTHPVLISSNSRDKSEYPSDSKYDIPLHLDNIIGVTLKNIVFTNRIYNIDEHNNKVTLVENNQELVASLPLGNYNIETLCDTLSNKLTNISIQNIEYKVYVDNLLKKIVICHSQNDTYYTFNNIFGLKFNSDLNKSLGFTKKEYFNNNEYTAEDFYNLTQNDIILIKLNPEFNRLNHVNNDPIFTILDISLYEFNKTINLSSVQTFKWTEPVSIKSLQVSWENLDKNPVSLNSDHMLYLEFYTK